MQDFTSIIGQLQAQVRLRPQQVAVYYPAFRHGNGRVAYTHLTYEQLDQLSTRVAQGLLAHGLTKGMHTAFMVKPSLEFFIVAYALLKAGIVPVLIDPGLGLKSIKGCLAQAKAEAFIGIPAAHVARSVLRWRGAGWKKLVSVGRRRFPGTLSFQKLLAFDGVSQPLPAAKAEELAAILFTSGSTGAPKAVMASHENFASQLQMMSRSLGLQPGEHDLGTYAPFSLFAPALGLTTIIPDMDFTRPAQVNPELIREAIEDFGVNMIFGSPALMKAFSKYAVQKNWNFPSLKRVISAGGPVAAATIEHMRKVLPEDACFYTAYGATEVMPVAQAESRFLLGPARAQHESGGGLCIGQALPQSQVLILRISDEPMEQLSPADILGAGEIGEIAVAGPHVTRAYYNNEAATRLAKVRDAKGTLYHRTGDLGYRDDAQELWFCGRKSHRVLTATGPMFTIPCEAVFNQHPWIERTALVGLGQGPQQKPCLCIETKRPLSQAEQCCLLAELHDVAGKYEHTKTIKTFLFHPAFPVDIRHNSKIFREKLKVWADDQLPRA